jgi:hypothetical protein
VGFLPGGIIAVLAYQINDIITYKAGSHPRRPEVNERPIFVA